jgi:hypothetical protein
VRAVLVAAPPDHDVERGRRLRQVPVVTIALVLAGLYVGGLVFVVTLCRAAARGDDVQPGLTDADIEWLAAQAGRRDA